MAIPSRDPNPPPQLPALPATVDRSALHVGRVRIPQRSGTRPTTDRGITPAFIWGVFSQWWKCAVPVGLVLSLAAGAVVWFLHVPMYEAAAFVKIESQAPYIAFEKGHSSSNTDLYVETQIELLRSPVLLTSVLKRSEIANIPEIQSEVDPVKYMQKMLDVTQVGKSELYQVSFKSPRARDAAGAVSAIVSEHLTTQFAEDKERSRIVIEVLEEERQERQATVKRLHNDVVELAKNVTGKDPFGQGIVTDVSAFTPAASLFQSVTEADVELEVLKAELQALNEAPILAGDKISAAGVFDLEVSNRADVRQFEAQINAIRDAIAQVKLKPRTKIGETWEKDPVYLRLNEQLKQREAEFQQLKESASKQLAEQRLRIQQFEHQQMIAVKTQEIASLNKKRETLGKKFDAHLAELRFSGAQSAELEFKKAELDREQRVFELIAARKLAVQTEMSAPARVSLIKEAIVPARPLEPIPFKLLGLACTLALVAPLGIAVAHEIVVRRISSAAQLTQESMLPLLGEVARFPFRPVAVPAGVLPARQRRERYVFAESIDSLRTNLMLTECVGQSGHRKVIAICSAASGEGKSSIASALAISIAEASGQPTLLIDADLRAPDIAGLLGVSSHPGITEVFSGKVAPDQALHRVGESQAFVMPAGKQRVNPHHVLTGSKIDDLLTTLRDKFSTIIIDTPPILGASESLVYARTADLVVFCSLADVSRARQVKVAVERLQSTGANIAGAVLSGVSVNRYVYQYGAYAAPG